MNIFKILIVSLLLMSHSLALDFTNIDAPLESLRSGNCEWGDFDGDDDLDLLISGRRETATEKLFFTGIYENLGGDRFEYFDVPLPGAAYGTTSWFDFDGDGDLDILISGYDGVLTKNILRIYINENNQFVPLDYEFHEDLSNAVWGDVDNDGDLDIFANGGQAGIYYLYLKIEGSYKPIELQTDRKLINGNLQLVDYDGDSDLDVFITGMSNNEVISYFLNNDGGENFTPVDPGIIGVWKRANGADFGDYDNDGDMDLVISGLRSVEDNSFFETKLYRNDDGHFNETEAELMDCNLSAVRWGDYDNDGDLDIILSGYNTGLNNIFLYRNDGNTFSREINSFRNAGDGAMDWGDYDNDGDLDLLITGKNESTETFFAEIYRNNIDIPNHIPDPPDNLTVTVTTNNVVLRWDLPADSETDRTGLSHNIYIGTYSKGNDVVGSHSNNDNGKRRITAVGNAGQKRFEYIKNLAPGKYFWSVQAIDHNFAGSKFAPEQVFNVEQGINLSHPNGGENLEVGEEIEIQWWMDNIEQVRLDMTQDGGQNWTNIARKISDDHYLWKVPNLLSDNCIIKVSVDDQEVANPRDLYGDISDQPFTIQDTFLPEVAVTNHEIVWEKNAPHRVAVHAADAAGLNRVAIFVRKGDESNYSNQSMNTIDGQNFYFEVPAVEITEMGLEYFVAAVDSNGNSNETEIQRVSVSCPDGLNADIPFHSGKGLADYRLFSIPLVQENNDVDRFLNNHDIYPYDNTKIRLFRFDNSQNNWLEYPVFSNVLIGRGYAMITTEPELTLQSDPGRTLPIANPAEISLKKGWNIIGNPFPFTIFTNHLDFDNGSFELWGYDGSWQEVDKLKPFVGYAVYTGNDGILTIHSQKIAGVAKESVKSPDWQINISLQRDEKKVGNYVLGQYASAKAGADQYDRHLPPLMPGQPGLCFIEDKEKIAKDFHPVKSFDHWDFKLINVHPNQRVSLTFEGIGNLNSSQEIFLIDKDVNIIYNLRVANQVELRGRRKAMNFALMYGSKDDIEQQYGNISLTPEKFELRKVFPNPFNPATQINFTMAEPGDVMIEIFSMTGKKIYTLVNEYKQAGQYSTVWNASQFSSGVYIVKMTAGNYVKMNKCILMK